MKVVLTEKVARRTLDNQLFRGIKQVKAEKSSFDLTLNALLKRAKVSKKRFGQYYSNQREFLYSLNTSFVDVLKERIPYVKSKEDLTDCMDRLIAMTRFKELMERGRIIFQLNSNFELDHFHSLKKQVFSVLSTRWHLFFKQLKTKTNVLDVEDLKEVFYTVLEESIVNDTFQNFHLLAYSLRVLTVVFDE